MTDPVGGSIPDDITLSLDETKVVLFALDDAIDAADDAALRSLLERAAQIIVEKLMPDLPDL